MLVVRMHGLDGLDADQPLEVILVWARSVPLRPDDGTGVGPACGRGALRRHAATWPAAIRSDRQLRAGRRTGPA